MLRRFKPFLDKVMQQSVVESTVSTNFRANRPDFCWNCAFSEIFPYQNIRWNYSISSSDSLPRFQHAVFGNKKKGQILKWVFQENKARQIFRKTIISYLPIRTHKCLIFGKFDVLCLLEPPVLRFALLPYYRHSDILANVLHHNQSLTIFVKDSDNYNLNWFSRGHLGPRKSSMPYFIEFLNNSWFVLLAIYFALGMLPHGYVEIILEQYQIFFNALIPIFFQDTQKFENLYLT